MGIYSTDPAAQKPVSGVIEADSLYVMDEARRRLRWSKAAYRSAVRRGLRVLRSGRRAYLYGSDIIAHIRGATEAGKAGES